MPKNTYRNISNTFFLVFLAFGIISKYLHCTKSQSLLPGLDKVDQLKRKMLSNSLWATEFGLSFLDLILL